MTCSARRGARRTDDGFTLIETLIALGILTTGILTLAALLGFGLSRLSGGANLVRAREKAAEAIEGVFMARDTRVISWNQIRNVSSAGINGIFLDGPQPLRTAGPDGIVNTRDDGPVETVVTPGEDGLIDTGDDLVVPLNAFTREIHISDVSPFLREVRVVVRYPASGAIREFVLSTYISAFA